MTADYKIRLYDTSGNLKAEITDFLKLSYTKTVNAPGLLALTLSGYHGAISSVALNGQFEVWRRPEGQSWYTDFISFIRKWNWEYTDLPELTFTGPGLLDMLRWRICAYTAGYNLRSKFVGAITEYIANTLVRYNLTTDATTLNGRLRAGTISGFSVETSGSYGTVKDWYCAYDNILATLQKLCSGADGDFDIVKTSSTTYQWRWYDRQLGTDRSATVKFAMGLGNMGNPTYHLDHISEASAAIVGGKGEEAARTTAVVTGNTWSSTNDTEIFVSATSIDTFYGLEDAGYAKLQEIEAKAVFGFDVLQSPACLYGVHYFLGDIVTAINPFTGVSAKYKVKTISVEFEPSGAEKIDVDLEWFAAVP